MSAARTPSTGRSRLVCWGGRMNPRPGLKPQTLSHGPGKGGGETSKVRGPPGWVSGEASLSSLQTAAILL